MHNRSPHRRQHPAHLSPDIGTAPAGSDVDVQFRLAYQLHLSDVRRSRTAASSRMFFQKSRPIEPPSTFDDSFSKSDLQPKAVAYRGQRAWAYWRLYWRLSRGLAHDPRAAFRLSSGGVAGSAAAINDKRTFCAMPASAPQAGCCGAKRNWEPIVHMSVEGSAICSPRFKSSQTPHLKQRVRDDRF
jgi:hypothetical protein